MTTLILTAVGTAVGGPIGGAVGAIVGQAADQAIFAPKARHGPRLGDLAVQTSSYGTIIPKIFGTMRVAGTVIWATDLREQRTSSSAGKGRPRSVAYSYSANFAVALSGRRIAAIRRIWADGKLLRGAAGDFKSATDFRIYVGDEDQPADPLIASVEGVTEAPAFRGIAYAVFEDFQLEDYGNRIPSLSFEVEAGSGDVAVGAIAEELSGGAVSCDETLAVTGYAATGDSVRSVIQTLAEMMSLELTDQNGGLVLSGRPGEPVILDDTYRLSPVEMMRRAAIAIPGEVSIAYYDPARDYQTGLQRATRGAPSVASDRRALPAVLSADLAKSLAERRLAWFWAERSRARLASTWACFNARPGSTLTLPETHGQWKVRRWTLGPMSIALELSRRAPAMAPAVSAAPGRSLPESDIVHGPTLLRLLDLPPLGDDERPALTIVASGSMPGWRRAPLLASFDGGESWRESGATGAPAVLGHSRSILPDASSLLFDDQAVLEVELAHDGMWLHAASDSALVDGANLAIVGSELIQFGRAEPTGPCRFRLTRLLRGRRGTEWAATGHVPDEAFTLIEGETVKALEIPAHAIGSEIQIVAAGIGDGSEGVSASLTIGDEGRRAPSPVHLKAIAGEGGAILIGWVRRSRQGWTWRSGSDTPLVEEQERYRITIARGDALRTVDTSQPSYVYSPAEQAEDGDAMPFVISVVQLGTHGPSRPATLDMQ